MEQKAERVSERKWGVVGGSTRPSRVASSSSPRCPGRPNLLICSVEKTDTGERTPRWRQVGSRNTKRRGQEGRRSRRPTRRSNRRARATSSYLVRAGYGGLAHQRCVYSSSLS